MVAVPGATPDTTPVPLTTVAMLLFALVHVPPPASVNAVVDDTQTLSAPDIPPGNGLIVTGTEVLQPVDVSVKDIVAVPPDTPVTTPLPPLVPAMLLLLVVHVPEPDASLSVVVSPTQAAVVPDMLAGKGKIVTVVVAVLPAPAV